MSKGGVIVLIIAALVFCGLGFVIGQVVSASDSLPGSDGDPAASQGYVDKLVARHTQELQTQIDELRALLGGEIPTGGTDSPGTTDPNNGGAATPSKVKVTAADVNIRASASTEAQVVGNVSNGTEMDYLGSTAVGADTWYHVRLSDGVEGYVASWLCGAPY